LFSVTQALGSHGDGGVSCSRIFLPLFARHGPLTLSPLSLQTLRVSWDFILLPLMGIRGPFLLHWILFPTCPPRPLLPPSLLGSRTCIRILPLRVHSPGGPSHVSNLLWQTRYHYFSALTLSHLSSCHHRGSTHRAVCAGILPPGVRGVSFVGYLDDT